MRDGATELTAPVGDEYIDVRETMKLLQVGRSTIDRFTDEYGLPCVRKKLGDCKTKKLFLRSDVEQFKQAYPQGKGLGSIVAQRKFALVRRNLQKPEIPLNELARQQAAGRTDFLATSQLSPYFFSVEAGTRTEFDDEIHKHFSRLTNRAYVTLWAIGGADAVVTLENEYGDIVVQNMRVQRSLLYVGSEVRCRSDEKLHVQITTLDHSKVIFYFSTKHRSKD